MSSKKKSKKSKKSSSKKYSTSDGKNFSTREKAKAHAATLKKSSSSSGSSSSKATAPKSVQQQVADIAAQAQKIKSAYDSSKSSFSQSDIDKVYGSASKAASAVKTLVDSGGVARATGGTLPKATAPETPADIVPLDQTKIPEVTPPAGDVTGATAGVAGLQEQIKVEEERRLKAEEERQKKDAEAQKSWLKSMVSPTDARTEAWDQTGIDAEDHFAEQSRGIKEVEKLTEEYNKVMEAKDLQIAQTNDKMASMNFINNQTAQIERNAAPQLNRISSNINAKAAMLEAQQGNFASAQSYVNQAVQDAVADNKFKFDSFLAVYEMNKDNFDRIEGIYADSFKSTMAVAQMEYEQALADKKMIGELLMNNPQAGIDIYNDSLDEAFKKIGMNPMSPERRLLEAQIANTLDNAGDGDTSGLDKDQTEILASYLGEVSKYKTREEALAGLNKFEAKIKLEVGDAGYQKIVEEVNRQFPDAGTSTTTSTPVTAYGAGQATQSAFVNAPIAVGNAAISVGAGIGNFFKGLFD